MRLKILVVVNLLFLCSIQTVFAELVTDQQGVKVTVQEVNLLLADAPEKAQLALLQDKEKLQVKLVQWYLTKAVAAKAKTDKLTEQQQIELNKIIDLFYFKQKLQQLATQNLPDFEPLAKLEYLAKQKRYVTSEQVAVEHILISSTTHSDAEALKLIKEIRAKLIKGADFSALALQFSDDPSVKVNQGKLGFFAKGEMVKPFEEAAYSLKINELSQPVKTRFGYHLIKKYAQKPASLKRYDEVRNEIITQLKNEYIQGRMDNYYDQLKIDNKMKINQTAVDQYIENKIAVLKDKLQKN